MPTGPVWPQCELRMNRLSADDYHCSSYPVFATDRKFASDGMGTTVDTGERLMKKVSEIAPGTRWGDLKPGEFPRTNSPIMLLTAEEHGMGKCLQHAPRIRLRNEGLSTGQP
jgi:hypothetical protein